MLTVPPELQARRWALVSERLVAKMLAELLFEEALHAEPDDGAGGRWRVDVGDATYRFTARRAALDAWRIDAGSVSRHGPATTKEGGAEAADPTRLLLDLHAARGLDPAVTALTVTELAATLAADAHLLTAPAPAWPSSPTSATSSSRAT